MNEMHKMSAYALQAIYASVCLIGICVGCYGYQLHMEMDKVYLLFVFIV